jgi:hypothetical protein
MISQKLLNRVSQISKNISNYLKDLNLSYREEILANLSKINEEV